MKNVHRKALHTNEKQVRQPQIPSYLLASVIMGGLLTALFYVLFVQLLYQDTYIEIIFTRRGLIPYMTTFLAFVAITQLCCLYFHFRHESRCLVLVSYIIGKKDRVDPESAADIGDQIDSQTKASAQTSLVISRVRRVMHRVENKGSSSDVAALLSEQAEIDRAILSESYAAIRFISWLIPVLGFIGTIYGISSAIAGFPALFQKASENIGDQLGPITENLGVAFETTLLALIKVAVVMFLTFAVQKRGKQLLNAFDEFCLDNLLGNIRGLGIPEEELPEPFRRLVGVLLHHVESMGEKFEKAVQQVINKIVEHEQQRWQSFTDTFHEISVEYQNAIHKTCQAVIVKSETLSAELRDFAPNFRTAVEEMFDQLRNLESQRVQEVAVALTDAGKQASNALIQAGQDNAYALKQTSDELQSGLTKIEELLKTGEELQTIQQMLHSNLQALTQTGEMKNAVQQMSDCTEKLIPVLHDLQKRRRMRVRIVDEFDEEPDQSPS